MTDYTPFIFVFGLFIGVIIGGIASWKDARRYFTKHYPYNDKDVELDPDMLAKIIEMIEDSENDNPS